MNRGKLLVFSDSHGFTKAMHRAILTHSPDAVFHLGDYANDADKLRLSFPEVQIYSLKGNCDLGSLAPLELCFSLFGFRIFACHGHKYSVKRSLLNLCYAAEEKSADICLFGHTHKALMERRAELTLLNPGASVDYGGSFALIEFIGDEFKAEILKPESSSL
jgi:putative phosphoesterase